MNNLITIITVCSRLEYLDKIYDSIFSQKYKNFKWIISFDDDKLPELSNKYKTNKIKLITYKNKDTDITNYAAINNIFDKYLKLETWICIVDDDNIMYPNYLYKINNLINNNTQFIYYKQVYSDNKQRFICKTKEIKEGHIDMAQVCFHSSIIEDTRFEMRYTADGLFYNKLFNKIKNNKEKWIILNENLCYYNFLLNSTKDSTIFHQNNLNLPTYN